MLHTSIEEKCYNIEWLMRAYVISETNSREFSREWKGPQDKASYNCCCCRARDGAGVCMAPRNDEDVIAEDDETVAACNGVSRLKISV